MDASEEAGKKLTVAIQESMRQLLPDSWAENEIQQDSDLLKAVLAENPDLEAASQELAAVWLVGNKVDTVYCGLESQGLCTLKLQLTGSRIVLAMSVEELVGYFPECNGSIQRAIELMKDLTQNDLPDHFSMPSFTAMHVRTGDIVFVPCGFVAFEKAISDISLSVRTECCYCCRHLSSVSSIFHISSTVML